ncbi:MAG: TOBE domain-containing protein [Acidobacteriia bacterium]|nr:TOBE domain-containing protein [Terriglobia bacterium]
MSLYERNRFPARVKHVQAGSAIDRIVAQIGEFEIESLMIHQDAEKLHLRPGDSVMVVIKPTEVVVQRPRHKAAGHGSAGTGD